MTYQYIQRYVNNFFLRSIQIIIIFLILFQFSSCSSKGDFGYHEKGAYEIYIAPTIKSLTSYVSGNPNSDLPLTTKEIKLRDYSKSLTDGFGYKGINYIITDELISLNISKKTKRIYSAKGNYLGILEQLPDNIEAKNNYIIRLINNDIQSIANFSQSAHFVFQENKEREILLNKKNSNISKEKRDSLKIRQYENSLIIEIVVKSITERIEGIKMVISEVNLNEPHPLSSKAFIEINKLQNAYNKLLADLEIYISNYGYLIPSEYLPKII